MARDKQNGGAEQHGDQFLANLDAKIAALQALRASYLAARSLGAIGAGVDVGSMSGSAGVAPLLGGPPMELPRGALLGKSLPAAIKLYLSAVKRKQTLKEIAAALKEGGVETTSTNLETPVSSAINRLKASGEVLRFNDGWALAEFYPESLRNKLSERNIKPAKKKPKKQSKRPLLGDGTNRDDQVLDYIAARPGARVATSDIAEEVGMTTQQVVMAIMRLARHKKIFKNEGGGYRVS